jgi:GNAT superfamily N-acetyltransferase
MVHINIPHEAPPGFHIREATLDDVDDITRLWFASFNNSHEFFDSATPNNEETRKWLSHTFTIGILAGPAALLTFVVEDICKNRKLVGFVRWQPPQPDGSQDIPLPAFPRSWDPELCDKLWGGMARSRKAVMGQRLHWMGEFIGTDAAYEGKGLASAFLTWACRQCDALGVDLYIDASQAGLPLYEKGFEFVGKKALVMPERPATYGTYTVVAMVRPPQKVRSLL